ncbi:hypothetical protein LTR37_021046 [Vermiconidia calcicola]|uniref:Uncharacterized protein n=1 Tax=Vermiconidia calcicola TaxID=1690605 RepID=A0ACC3MCN0_9PEZI|nr:hypothetical protein LTR37_021046 [Vermiconidia calcicola]
MVNSIPHSSTDNADFPLLERASIIQWNREETRGIAELKLLAADIRAERRLNSSSEDVQKACECLLSKEALPACIRGPIAGELLRNENVRHDSVDGGASEIVVRGESETESVDTDDLDMELRMAGLNPQMEAEGSPWKPIELEGLAKGHSIGMFVDRAGNTSRRTSGSPTIKQRESSRVDCVRHGPTPAELSPVKKAVEKRRRQAQESARRSLGADTKTDLKDIAAGFGSPTRIADRRDLELGEARRKQEQRLIEQVANRTDEEEQRTDRAGDKDGRCGTELDRFVAEMKEKENAALADLQRVIDKIPTSSDAMKAAATPVIGSTATSVSPGNSTGNLPPAGLTAQARDDLGWYEKERKVDSRRTSVQAGSGVQPPGDKEISSPTSDLGEEVI